MIASFFTLAAFSKLFGVVWRGFCDFIATPIGAALIAGFVMYWVGVVHERHSLNAAWQAKWDAAEAQAEHDRLQRDATIKLKIEMNANNRLDELAKRKAELEEKVQAYESEEEKQRALGAAGKCSPLIDSSDERWLRDAQRNLKPKARRGLTLRLRTFGR